MLFPHPLQCGRMTLEAQYSRYTLAVPAGALAPERSAGPGGPPPLESAVAAATGLAARACPLVRPTAVSSEPRACLRAALSSRCVAARLGGCCKALQQGAANPATAAVAMAERGAAGGAIGATAAAHLRQSPHHGPNIVVGRAAQEQGGCGTLNLVQGAVRRAPRGLTLCLGWGAAPPSDADLGAVLAALPVRLDPRAAFPGAPQFSRPQHPTDRHKSSTMHCIDVFSPCHFSGLIPSVRVLIT